MFSSSTKVTCWWNRFSVIYLLLPSISIENFWLTYSAKTCQWHHSRAINLGLRRPQRLPALCTLGRGAISVMLLLWAVTWGVHSFGFTFAAPIPASAAHTEGCAHTDTSVWSHTGNRGYTSACSPSLTLQGTGRRPDMLPKWVLVITDIYWL